MACQQGGGQEELPMMDATQSVGSCNQGLTSLVEDMDQNVENIMRNVFDRTMTDLVFTTADQIVEHIKLQQWTPEIDRILEARMPQLIEEAMADLPSIISQAIDDVLGPYTLDMFKRLANGTYECALPCYCPEGCTGETLAEAAACSQKAPQGTFTLSRSTNNNEAFQSSGSGNSSLYYSALSEQSRN